MMPLSVTVSLELAKPFVPYGPAMMESVKFIVEPASKASLQPSLSESKSFELIIPSPSVSKSVHLSKTVISSKRKSFPCPVAVKFLKEMFNVALLPLFQL